ncbi:MAG: AmmeMemoRadiSam system protein B [Gammaproteobacteria bacterium]
MAPEPLDSVRAPAVSGLFYPATAAALRTEIDSFLRAVPGPPLRTRPHAVIVPHAGYAYSGAIAAAAYRRLEPWRAMIHRVVLLGPPHREPVRGAATVTVDAFRTPLGDVPVDRASLRTLIGHDAVTDNRLAHLAEHALEVQLPFLQGVLDDFSIIPLLIADMTPAATAALLEPWWHDPSTLLLVSSDLSHFHHYDEAREIDAVTDAAIMTLDPDYIGPQQACGCHALNGLLHLAREQDAAVVRLAFGNSGDAGGSRARVVGYAAYAVQ